MEREVDGRSVYAYTGGRPWTAAPAAGADPALLFVHGAAHDHGIFALQSRYFAHHGFRVLVPDLPGHGRSAGPPCDSIEALGAWLKRLLDAVQVEHAAVAAHSMGSLAALDLAARAPDRVTRLALLGPAVPMAVSDALLDAAAHDEPEAHALITGWSHGPRGQLGGNRQPGLWLAGQTHALLARAAPGVLHTDLLACQRYEGGLAAAASVRCPTLLVLGARDQMAPPRNATALAQALPQGRTVTLPDTGHAMMTEAPDALLDALRAFLA